MLTNQFINKAFSYKNIFYVNLRIERFSFIKN